MATSRRRRPPAHRDDPQPASHLLARRTRAPRGRANGAQVDRRQTELRGQRPCQRTRVEQALLDEDGAQLPTGLLLQVERAGKLFGQQGIVRKQHIAEPGPRFGGDHRSHLCGRNSNRCRRVRCRLLKPDHSHRTIIASRIRGQ